MSQENALDDLAAEYAAGLHNSSAFNLKANIRLLRARELPRKNERPATDAFGRQVQCHSYGVELTIFDSLKGEQRIEVVPRYVGKTDGIVVDLPHGNEAAVITILNKHKPLPAKEL